MDIPRQDARDPRRQAVRVEQALDIPAEVIVLLRVPQVDLPAWRGWDLPSPAPAALLTMTFQFPCSFSPDYPTSPLPLSRLLGLAPTTAIKRRSTGSPTLRLIVGFSLETGNYRTG